MLWRLLLVAIEVLVITLVDYKMSGEFYSLDVLYCLPIIQAAHISSIRSLRQSDTQMAALAGVVTAVAWSMAEAAVVWPHYPLGALTINIITRSITFTVLGRVVAKLWKERDYSRKDALTGLANRVELSERFAVEQSRSDRTNKPYSLLLINIDRLRALNETFGRRAGDTVLKSLSDILRGNSRNIDTVARIDEDTFVMLFPETDEYICGVLILRIRSAAQSLFQTEGWPLSLSIGRATITGAEHTLEEIMLEAGEKVVTLSNGEDSQWNWI